MHHLIEDDRLADWVSDRILWGSGRGFEEHARAFGIVNDAGRVLAAVVYHDYRPQDGVIEISMAADNPTWARKENIRALLFHPFRTLNVWKLRAVTLLSEEHAIKTFEHVGFKREAILGDEFGRKRHAWVGRMRQPDYTRIYEAD